MGFNNPDMPWSDVEALLSGRGPARGRDGRAPGSSSWNAGGDGPALGRKRQPFEPAAGRDTAASPDVTRPLMRPDIGHVPYAELHCHSNFSFLDGASHPEALAE
ncbi:MAG: hypothetical protein ACH37H_16075, partial [Ilumatobacteraceae bacterium]